MMSEWNKVEDVMPEIGQPVWYYFDKVGTWRGTFDGYYTDSEGVEWKGMHMFSSDVGFLTGDVTHWMNDQEERPNDPR